MRDRKTFYKLGPMFILLHKILQEWVVQMTVKQDQSGLRSSYGSPTMTSLYRGIHERD